MSGKLSPHGEEARPLTSSGRAVSNHGRNHGLAAILRDVPLPTLPRMRGRAGRGPPQDEVREICEVSQ
jgi:hypothetical protein